MQEVVADLGIASDRRARVRRRAAGVRRHRLVATLGVGDGWSASGPRLAPAVASVLLIVLAALFLSGRARSSPSTCAEAAEGTHWPTPALLLGLLVGYALPLSALGYALATTIFFWLAAWLLGSEQPARDC